MIEVAGKPLLEHTLSALREAAIKDVLVVVNYKAEKIKEYFGDGSSVGMNIDYVVQNEVKGTADAFGFAEGHVDNDFVAAYGDLLITPNTVKSAVRLHRRTKSWATLTTLHVEHPEHYGIIRTEGDRVVEIVEKPTPETAANKPINAGLYVFSTEIFEAIRRTQPSARGELEVTDSIRLLIEGGKKVMAATIAQEDWLDVGSPWHLLDANTRLLTKVHSETLGAVEEGVHLIGPVVIRKGARVRSGAYIEGPAYIGEGSDIGPNCYIRPHTSIGGHVRIGNACEIKNSLIMSHAHIGHLSYVGDSIIGEGCNLGAGTITANFRFDQKPVKMMVKESIVDTGRTKLGIVVGDNTKTGVGVLFMPGVKVGCNCWIGANLVVSRDVPSDTIRFLRQRVDQTAR